MPRLEAYYENTIGGFISDARLPEELAKDFSERQEALNPKLELSEQQINAWISGFRYLSKNLADLGISDAHIGFEVPAGNTGSRIDVVVSGRNESRKPAISLLELKTWHTQRRNERRYEVYPYVNGRDDKALLVNLYTHDEETADSMPTLSSSIERDPREQVQSYRTGLLKSLSDKHGQVKGDIVNACVLLYNCTKLSEKFREALDYNVSPTIFEEVPIYTVRAGNGSRSVDDLFADMAKRCAGGDGKNVYEKLMESMESDA